MKKIKQSIFAVMAIAMFVLTGCTDFADTPGKSVWSEGTWILPWVTGIGSAIFGYITYKAATSGSYSIDPVTGVRTDFDENVPFYKIGQFYFSVGLFIATVFIIWNTISNR
jgi:hypothetical protein